MTRISLWFGRVLGYVFLDRCANTPELRRQALDIDEDTADVPADH